MNSTARTVDSNLVLPVNGLKGPVMLGRVSLEGSGIWIIGAGRGFEDGRGNGVFCVCYDAGLDVDHLCKIESCVPL